MQDIVNYNFENFDNEFSIGKLKILSIMLQTQYCVCWKENSLRNSESTILYMWRNRKYFYFRIEKL